MVCDLRQQPKELRSVTNFRSLSPRLQILGRRMNLPRGPADPLSMSASLIGRLGSSDAPPSLLSDDAVSHYLGRDVKLAEIAMMKLETRTKL